MNEEPLTHEQAAALLPWLVNGTLEGDERDRVERHVRACLACRTELGEQTALRALVRRQATSSLTADAQFERLRTRFEQRPERAGWSSRRMLAAAAALAILAVGVLLGVDRLWNRSAVDSAPAYRTLSSDAADDALIDVIFADGVRETEIRALLLEVGAEIVAGPSRTLGRYTLRVERGTAPPDIDALAAALLRDERVRFAARTYSPQAREGRSGDGGSADHDVPVEQP